MDLHADRPREAAERSLPNLARPQHGQRAPRSSPGAPRRRGAGCAASRPGRREERVLLDDVNEGEVDLELLPATSNTAFFSASTCLSRKSLKLWMTTRTGSPARHAMSERTRLNAQTALSMTASSCSSYLTVLRRLREPVRPSPLKAVVSPTTRSRSPNCPVPRVGAAQAENELVLLRLSSGAARGRRRAWRRPEGRCPPSAHWSWSSGFCMVSTRNSCTGTLRAEELRLRDEVRVLVPAGSWTCRSAPAPARAARPTLHRWPPDTPSRSRPPSAPSASNRVKVRSPIFQVCSVGDGHWRRR